MLYAIGDYLFDSDYLEHHGILGQKWGVRRYQNKDGSYTPEGKERRSKSYEEDTMNQLSKEMRSIGYSEFTHLQSPAETKRKGKGSCHDQVLYELDALRKKGIDAKARFMIEYDPKSGQGGTTHSYVYVETEDGVLYFENAYKGQEGVHKYKSVDDIEKHFIDLRNSGNWGNSKKFNSVEFQDLDPSTHSYGEDLQEFIERTLV